MHKTKSVVFLSLAVAFSSCGESGGGDPAAGGTAAPTADVSLGLPDAVPSAPSLPPDATPDAVPSAIPDARAGADAASMDALPADATVDMGPIHQPRPRPPATSTLAAPAGWRWARGLIHMHSVHSHDACDGRPKDENGVGDAPCLADLRAALCNGRLDFTLLTDHPETFADVTFEEALLHDAAAGDELVRNADGEPVGNRIACPGEDAVRTLLSPGSEGDVMPVLLPRHAADRDWYRTRSAEAVAHLKETGAVVLHAHTEERTFEELLPIGLDGLEIYNLHANVNPNGTQLGLVLPDILKVINARESPPHPDLALLALLRENPDALRVWNQFIVRQRMLGTAGSDIHQNLPPLVRPTDGERLDSYRRLTTWFANYVLVHDVTLDELRGALLNGRLVVVFHLMGEPDGFDFSGTRADGGRVELGAETPFEAGMTLNVAPPTSVPVAHQDVRLLRISEVGGEIVSEVVAQGPMALTYTPPGPGAYRVEISQTPEHLRAELGSVADDFVRPTPWIYTNPIYLR